MISQIKASVGERLRADGGGFRKLVMIHSAVPIGVSLVLMLVSALAAQIAPDGGLSNMGTHALISTVLVILQLAASVAVVFWDGGLLYSVLGVLRGRRPGVGSLTEGFSRFLPIVTSGIFRWLNYMLLMMVSGTVSSLLMSLMPMSEAMYQDILAFTENPTFPLEGSIASLVVIYMVVYCVVLAVLLVPTLYRHRLTTYCIMDDEPIGGFSAVLLSTTLMRGNRRKLFRLDLSFWWFYALELLISALSMGELIFADFSWLFPLLGLAARLVLYVFAKPKIALSYGLFYETLLKQAQEPQPEVVEPPKPKKMPWKY